MKTTRRPVCPAAGFFVFTSMSKTTKIQWCDSTVNPGMGCDGCELWPTLPIICNSIASLVSSASPTPKRQVRNIIANLTSRFSSPTELWYARDQLINTLSDTFPHVPSCDWISTIERLYRCYAGILHLRYGGTADRSSIPSNPGFSPSFDIPTLFPERMARAARWNDLSGTSRRDEPWLNGLPRLIFVSDMGDALSRAIDFDFLKTEVIDTATSPEGLRHVWLWLTKRPERMAEFAGWLLTEHRLQWPGNLIAMTSVTNRATRSRIVQLRKVPSKLCGLSVEPLIESVELDLDEIDWLIVGGESGTYAGQFDLEWARSLREQCRQAGAAFFVKQLGANVAEEGFPIELDDGHGGDWDQWPLDLRVREFPGTFRAVTRTRQLHSSNVAITPHS